MASAPRLDGNHWRQRAEKMRGLAAESHDPKFKRRLLKIAKDYEKLAKRADERADERG
jgi:hypothetical protein